MFLLKQNNIYVEEHYAFFLSNVTQVLTYEVTRHI